MKITKLQVCEEYKNATYELVDEFVKKYFTYDDGSVSGYYIIGDKTLPHLAPNAFSVSEDLFYNMDEAYEALYSDLPKDRVISRSVDYADRPKDVSFYNYCRYLGNPKNQHTKSERQKDLKKIRNTYKQLLSSMGVKKTREEIDEFMKQIER